MFAAIALSVLAVAIGAGLALLPSRSAAALGVIRTFALTAALGAVLFHLLPEAFAVLGAWSLAAVGLGIVLPSAVGRIAETVGRFGREKEAAGIEAAFLGLCVHHVGDGLALGTYLGEGHREHGHHDIVLALTAHTVPVAAMIVILYEATFGRRSAMVRAGWLALAGAFGAALSGWMPAAPSSHWTAWISGLVAGLLVHVVTHELRANPPRTLRTRAADLLAAVVGILASSLGSGGAGHGDHLGSEDALRDRFLSSLGDLAFETAPLLLLGLTVAAAVQVGGSKIPGGWLRPRGILADATRGAVVGAPLPLCSCSALPISAALRRRGASPALVVAFLLATPELGAETFALTGQFLGWPFAVLRLLGALLVSMVAAAVVGRLATAPAFVLPPGLEIGGRDAAEPWLRRFLNALDELVYHIGAWMVVGVVAAATLDAFVPAEFFSRLGGAWHELPVVTALSIPAYVCAASATPVAAVLVAKGLSPGAALVALLLGPATNLATLAFLRSSYGNRALLAGTAAVVLVTSCLAVATNVWFGSEGTASQLAASGPEHGVAWTLAALLVALLFLKSVWQSGIRGWLASLGHAPHLEVSNTSDAPCCGDAACGAARAGASQAHH